MKVIYPKFMDKTPLVVNISDGINENGGKNIVHTYSGKCHYIEKSKTSYNKDGVGTQLVGKLTIGCDIAPNIDLLEGEVIINSNTYKIFRGSRVRNPDGSVHHTELELE